MSESVAPGGREAFPFVFIDPTGWTEFSMAAIAPLLQFRPGEVLVNFMTGHIRRFIESPHEQTQQSFEELFGSAGYRERVEGHEGLDREDALVNAYRENIMCTGGFEHSCVALVLHPQLRRSHFHLIYATRHPRGVEVFKTVERSAMGAMATARAEAQQRQREERTHQLELFDGGEAADSRYYKALPDRYVRLAPREVESLLQTKERVSYDEAWSVALSHPLVWKRDLKAWLRQLKSAELVILEGIPRGRRVPQHGAGHTIQWIGGRR